MKKFRFTMATLLNYKDQVLEKEKNDLASLNLLRAEAVEEKLRLENELRRAGDEFNEKAAKGISPVDMMVFSNYHNALRMDIEETEKKIEKLNLDVEKQMVVVTEASKEVKSLEKLEEKQLEDYRFMVTKADEQFIEEYVNNNSVRAMLEAQ